MSHVPLSHVRTDGKGKFLGVDVCTCEVSDPDFRWPDNWKPTDESCPLFDRHVALHERITKGVTP